GGDSDGISVRGWLAVLLEKSQDGGQMKFKQNRMRTIAVFVSGVAIGVTAVLFFGGDRGQSTVRAGQSAEPMSTAPAEQKDASQIGRYQTFKLENPNWYCGLIDTTNGKVWGLQLFAEAPKYCWVAVAEPPK